MYVNVIQSLHLRNAGPLLFIYYVSDMEKKAAEEIRWILMDAPSKKTARTPASAENTR